MSDPARRLSAVVIEDDAAISSLIVEVFRAAGLEPFAADNGEDGVNAVREHEPAITTIDVNMGGIDGFETARRIRAISPTFIIMVSALGDETDVVLGLGAGADDYVTKPFRPRELRARVEAALRRRKTMEVQATTSEAAAPPVAPTAASSPAVTSPGSPPADDWLVHRELRLNPATRTALVGTDEVDLTRTEFDLLAALVESRRRVRSKADLALVLRGEEAATSYYVGEADKRAVEAHMTNLRRKLGDNASDPQYIETVRGVGYRLTL